ncbi:hypothetical protein LOC54_10180 [Acetobacter sp. AN02]|uniref:hypothetical protein n=1 Tax=Acetobacter sp. AN02 TaxID=2894186 RepID=UPI0024343067|nr:hypothetical protein [Acetobacter sp. AN02]MDG6095464.1 hypothetical protein [Acetobacter sp. AN02]
MSKKVELSSEMDQNLSILLYKNGISIRSSAEIQGRSRNFIHRRSQFITSCERKKICTPLRERAGEEPLPVGHAITWSAIQIPPYVSRSGQNDDFPAFARAA